MPAPPGSRGSPGVARRAAGIETSPAAYGSKVTLPRTLVEADAGRFAFAFTVGFVVAELQSPPL
jgi:hypothetical protein